MYLLILVAYFFSTPFVFSQSSDDAIKNLKSKYPVLMKTYGESLQDLDVEYIVAVDLSGTMSNRIPGSNSTYIQEVKNGLVQFLNAVPENSKISVIGFGTTVRQIQIPVQLNQSNRANINGVVQGITATEGYTDLKGAIQKLLEGCSSTSTIKYLFIFTDFNDSPPSNSPYAGLKWEDLQNNYRLLSKGSLIETFALKLPLAANSGRDLDKVRMVFPGLNVIDFDQTSLQSWFSDRSGRMMEQNLWTFISKDLKDIQSKNRFNLKLTTSLNGKVNVNGTFDSLPEYITGLKFTDAENVKLSHAKDFLFKPSAISDDSKTNSIGKLSFKDKTNPIAVGTGLSIRLKGKIETHADAELEKLVAVVSLRQQDINPDGENASYLDYSQELSSIRSFAITWPLLVFILAGVFVILFIVSLIRNTILPNKIKGLALFVESNTAISSTRKFRLPEKEIISIGAEQAKNDIVVKEMAFDAKLAGTRGAPFNFIYKKAIRFSYNEKNVALVELNGKPINKQSFKIKPDDKVSIRQGATYNFTFSLKPENN